MTEFLNSIPWTLIIFIVVVAYIIHFAKRKSKITGQPQPAIKIEWPKGYTGQVSIEGTTLCTFPVSKEDAARFKAREDERVLKYYPPTRKSPEEKVLIKTDPSLLENRDHLSVQVEYKPSSKLSILPRQVEIDICIAYIEAGTLKGSKDILEKEVLVTGSGQKDVTFEGFQQKYQDLMNA